MELYDYFENTKGFGVLSTSDEQGRVDAAVYSRPHMMEDGTMAFIMNDRLSHHNLKSNPHAAFLFKEDGQGYKGKRFFLTMVKEEQDSPQIAELQRRTYPPERQFAGPKFLVYFKITKELPLIGPEKES
jgi:hypothetical protein